MTPVGSYWPILAGWLASARSAKLHPWPNSRSGLPARKPATRDWPRGAAEGTDL